MSGGKYRPLLKLPRTLQDNLLELAAVAGLLGMAFVLWAAWPELPARIPTHFGASGLPDGWGGRESLFILPVIGLFEYAVMTALYLVPQIYNIPVQLTEANAALQYGLARSFIQWLKTEIIWLFWFIERQSIQVALGRSAGLGRSFLGVTMLAVFGTLGAYLWLSLRNRGGGPARNGGGA